MNKGPISRIPLQRIESRDESRLPTAWVGHDQESTGRGINTSHLFYSEHTDSVPVTKGAPVLVMLRDAHAPVMAELLTPGSAGERVYVLAPAGWGQTKLDPQILSCPTMLIRRLPEVPVAGVYRPGGARLWLGATTSGAAPWCLDLDTEQAESFRQVFLRLFWHHAIDEGWTGGKQLGFRPAAERPFDVPELPRAAPVRLLTTDEEWDVDMRDAVVHLNHGKPPTRTPRRLWFPASGSYHHELSQLTANGAQVVWENLSLPDLVVGKNTGVAVLPGTRGRLQIVLNRAQAAAAERILTTTTSWNFGTQVRLGDHTNSGAQLWLDGAAAASGVDPEQRIELPNVQSEQLRNTAATDPTAWPAAQPLALTVRYRWLAVPPRLPAGSEEDPLVGRWRQLDEEWSETIGKTRATLQSTADHRGSLGRTFAQLVSGLLGFERTHQSLLHELTALDELKPSAAGPLDTPALLQRLTAVTEKARTLQGDQQEAERKAAEDTERAKQEHAWQSRVKEAKHSLPQHQIDLGNKQERLPSLIKELATVEEELPNADKKTKKDLQVQKARVTDEITNLQEGIKRLEGQVKDLTQRTTEPFVFKAPPKPTLKPAHGTSRFVPQA